jgi:sugar fermentation stimulation protein A
MPPNTPAKTAPSLQRGVIPWPRFVSGALIRRYQRFLADVRLRNGHVVTAHCPNSGSMKTCCEPGRTVYLSRSDNPRRRLRYTWELIAMPTSLVGVNTMIPNRLVAASILAGRIPDLLGYETLRREVNYGRNSRIDILLERGSDERCYIEVKNCTLVEGETASFPDAVTQRGLKHVVELEDQVELGNRAGVFFLIQRMDARTFRPADDIDPTYGRELRQARGRGVELFAYDVSVDLEGISLRSPVPIEL